MLRIESTWIYRCFLRTCSRHAQILCTCREQMSTTAWQARYLCLVCRLISSSLEQASKGLPHPLLLHFAHPFDTTFSDANLRPTPTTLYVKPHDSTLSIQYPLVSTTHNTASLPKHLIPHLRLSTHPTSPPPPLSPTPQVPSQAFSGLATSALFHG